MKKVKKQEGPIYSEVITKVHQEFESAGEKLYQEALQIINSTKILDEEKVRKLKKLGFTSSREVLEAESIIQKKTINYELAKTINYYKLKYPLNKFISESSVKTICLKYGLIYGVISKYKGFVPSKNMMIIENFIIEKRDMVMRIGSVDRPGLLFFPLFKSSKNKNVLWDNGECAADLAVLYYKVKEYIGLIIAAPQSDFDINDREMVRHFQIVNKPVPDPVVLAPVNGGYLIVTAWGDEASDPLVQNENNN